jgi:hypothetical protein
MPRRGIPRSQPDVLHEANLAHIRSQDVRVAYIHLVRTAQGLDGFECYPTNKGVIRDFRYYSGDEQPFAFIVNAESLLFYLRKPSIARFKPKLRHLREAFVEVKQPRDNEITIRVSNLVEAKRLMREIFGVVDAERPVATER